MSVNQQLKTIPTELVIEKKSQVRQGQCCMWGVSSGCFKVFPGEAASPDRRSNRWLSIPKTHRRVTSHCSSNLTNPGCTRFAAYVTRFTSSLSSCLSHKENTMGLSPTWTPKIELAQLKHPHQIQVKDWPQLSWCRQKKTQLNQRVRLVGKELFCGICNILKRDTEMCPLPFIKPSRILLKGDCANRFLRLTFPVLKNKCVSPHVNTQFQLVKVSLFRILVLLLSKIIKCKYEANCKHSLAKTQKLGGAA